MAKLIKAYKDNFTIVDNDIFMDKRLSYKDLGLLCQLLSLPDNWNFNVPGLSSLHTDGKASVMAGLENLEKYGYLTRKQARSEGGYYAGYDYYIYQDPKQNKDYSPSGEIPLTVEDQRYAENRKTDNRITDKRKTDKPSTDYPSAENPPTVNRITDNQSQLNTICNKESNNKNVVVYNSEDELSDVINDDEVFISNLTEQPDKEAFLFKKKMDYECYKTFSNNEIDLIKMMRGYSVQMLRYLLCTYPDNMDEVKEAQTSIFKALSAKQFVGKENIINDFSDEEYQEILNIAFSINSSSDDIQIRKTPVAYLTGVINNMIKQHINNQGDVKNE